MAQVDILSRLLLVRDIWGWNSRSIKPNTHCQRFTTAATINFWPWLKVEEIGTAHFWPVE